MLQSSLGPSIAVAGLHPDFVLVAVISWTLLRGGQEGLLWAIIGGLSLDLLSIGPFGASLIALVVTGLLAMIGFGRMFGGYLVLPLALAFPLSMTYYLIYGSLLSVFGKPIAWLPSLTYVVLPASLLNMAAMLLVFPLLRLLHRRTGREEITW
jgi:rod shape-determining protein MreD